MGAIIAPYATTSTFAVDAANFDGTNDWLTRSSAFTGAANSTSGTVSFWMKYTTVFNPNFQSNTTGLGASFNLGMSGGNRPNLLGATSGGASNVALISTGTYASGAWHHYLFSWDGPTSAMNLYVDDVSDLSGGGSSISNANATDWTNATWIFGAQSTAGANKISADLAEIYMAPGQYIDFSVTANRRKFITAGLQPAYLGTDGALPTGTKPLIYLHLDTGETANNFALNRTGAGDFTVHGALTTAGTHP